MCNWVRQFLLTTAFWAAVLLVMMSSQPAAAMEKPLPDNMKASIQAIFPKVTRLGEPEQNPPVVPVYQLNELLGYAFRSTDLSNLPGFSGDPIDLLVGIDTQGKFVGVHVLNHHEPIFMHGLGEGPMFDFIYQYTGRSVKERIIVDSRRAASADESSNGTVYIDGVTKATVSVLVINDILLSVALKVARAKLEGFEQAEPSRVRLDLYEALDWQQLHQRDWVRRWSLATEDVEKGLGESLATYPDLEITPVRGEDGRLLFSDLYYAYLNPPSIGQNLLGVDEYTRLMASRKPGEHLLLVASNGPYPYVEEDFRPGTVPTRVGMSQNGLPVDIRDTDFLDDSGFQSAQGPYLEHAHIFRIKEQAGFDPAQPLNLNFNLDVNRNHLIRDQASFSDSYVLPEYLFEKVEVAEVAAPDPLWLRIWKDRVVDISVLMIALVILTGLFIWQHRMTRHSTWFHRFRWGFLLFTLGFVGFYTQGQLSVVNIYTLLLALVDGFDITIFLLDPIIFLLWTYVFISLFLWGRGLFCGWLCPFGVMQELTSKAAKLLKIRQLKIAEQRHQLLQKIKYLVLVVLVGSAFYSLSVAEQLAEIEPFKTAVTMAFVRSWPFVVYTALLLAAGLYIHKFFCRYLCPLGAGLAILGRFSVFKWLQRRKECGAPCKLCKVRCEIDSINRDGSIDYDECVQCLECIVILNNADQCAIELSQQKQRKSRRIAVKQVA
ncbi:4Fe-4S binding protein [Pontibacterium granulatum]|uniref:NosR/NirI family protein n=1 Tax=Pontibacterium granulatum TaxID=2036029 RepID=UPI00249C1AC1|nr:NosR/NirI family protein [Pontibacterium granulatum]MDI3326512.1 4Fe-4S binding protein [Pontibacterium granulatum]